MIKYALSLLLIGIVVFSCKKSSDKGPSKTELITSATWKYDTIAIDADKNGTPDTQVPPGYLEQCELDNTLTLKADSTGVLDEGPTKCSSTDPQTTPIHWSFKENETVLSSPDPIFGGFSGDAKINTLTSTKLEVVKEVTITGFPISVNVVLDLKH
jgi:hypothetical protein